MSRGKLSMKEIIERDRNVAKGYRNVTIGIFGSHSAKEIGIAAKVAGLKTVIIVEKGRANILQLYCS